MTQPGDEACQVMLDILIMISLNLLFWGLVALGLWPLGQVRLAVSLAWGYAILWLVVLASSLLLMPIERIFRLGVDSNFNAYVILNVVVSGWLVAGWSAFAAVTVGSFSAGTAVWLAAILYLVGFLSSYIAFAVTTTFYQGTIYKLASLPLALISYFIFALWPSAGWVIYGWFLAFFGLSPT
jgi:hypothetical protein